MMITSSFLLCLLLSAAAEKDQTLRIAPESMSRIQLKVSPCTQPPVKSPVQIIAEVSGSAGRAGKLHFSSPHGGSLNQWQLEVGQEDSSTSTTLCEALPSRSTVSKRACASVWVWATNPGDATVKVNLRAERRENLLLEEDRNATANLRTGWPAVFKFAPAEWDMEAEYLVTVETVSNPFKCILVGINPAEAGCPWRDTEESVSGSRLRARMLGVGYFPVRARAFPQGFTVSLVPLASSTECYTHMKNIGWNETEAKEVLIRVERVVNDYTPPVLLSLFMVILVSLVFFLVWGFVWSHQLRNNRKRIQDRMSRDPVFQKSSRRLRARTADTTSELQRAGNPWGVALRGVTQTRRQRVPTRGPAAAGQDRQSHPPDERASAGLLTVSAVETAVEGEGEQQETNTRAVELCQKLEQRDTDANRLTVDRLLHKRLHMADFSRVVRDEVWHRRQRSLSYLYLVPLVSLFYMIPSSQLVFTEQQRAATTGDMEKCYLNYGCSRPWWIFQDFNHIISNSGYIIFGLIFILMVRVKSAFLPVENQPHVDHLGQIGLLQQHSIFYTMGLCMVLQGIFSAIFHTCPSNVSLQFDTTMMYIMIGLVLVKLYQSRHPDISTSAWACMYWFALLLTIEALSLHLTKLFSYPLQIFLYCIFAMVYLVTVLYIAVDRYYYGATMKGNVLMFAHNCLCTTTSPLYPLRLILLLVFVVVNIALLLYNLSSSIMDPNSSLSSDILAIMAVNLTLFLLFYTIRKGREIWRSRGKQESRLRNGMRFMSFLFLFLSLVLGGLAFRFYSRRHQSRNETPPESRNRNELCSFHEFFDNHDMWHFLSSAALFLAFVFLLTIDDDLLLVDRDKIEVF